MNSSPQQKSCAICTGRRASPPSSKKRPMSMSAALSTRSVTERARMSWKTAHRSIYYDGAPEPANPDLSKAHTALLVIDVQNTYLARPDRASLPADEQRRYDAWTPFHDRMHNIVLPRTQ